MYAKEPIDWTADGPVGLGVEVELEFQVEVALAMVMEAGMDSDVVFTAAVVVFALVNELVVRTEDRLADGAKVELGTALVEETKDVKLLDNWYKLNPLGPPQISRLFAAHAILPIM